MQIMSSSLMHENYSLFANESRFCNICWAKLPLRPQEELKLVIEITRLFLTLSSSSNRPFPSSLVPLFQNESKCETFHMKVSFACSFIFMQIKVIFIRMVSHLDSFWNRGTRELGNGLFYSFVERADNGIARELDASSKRKTGFARKSYPPPPPPPRSLRSLFLSRAWSA